MKHLFKLKKDGEVVGYLEIEIGGVVYKRDLQDDLTWENWTNDECDFDEALPFVCNDKNGDKVFAGDRITAKTGIDDEGEYDEMYIVVYHKKRFQYMALFSDNVYVELEDIPFELIKE